MQPVHGMFLLQFCLSLLFAFIFCFSSVKKIQKTCLVYTVDLGHSREYVKHYICCRATLAWTEIIKKMNFDV